MLGVEALPGGWEVPRNIGRALADEMVVRAVTLTGAAYVALRPALGFCAGACAPPHLRWRSGSSHEWRQLLRSYIAAAELGGHSPRSAAAVAPSVPGYTCCMLDVSRLALEHHRP